MNWVDKFSIYIPFGPANPSESERFTCAEVLKRHLSEITPKPNYYAVRAQQPELATDQERKISDGENKHKDQLQN